MPPASPTDFRQPAPRYAPAGVFLLLLVFALLLRIPASGVLPIDNPDEGAYLLMGRDLARGYLPYENSWSLKPPLGFYYYAVNYALVGNSFLGFRLLGALWVTIAAFAVQAAARRIASPVAGMTAGLLLIGLTSASGSGNAVVTEHVALLPLAAIAYMVSVTGVQRPLRLGLLIGVCVMIRTNLLILLPAALWLCRERFPGHWRAPARVVAGCLLPATAFGLLFAATGLFEVFWKTSFWVPAMYARDKIAMIQGSLPLNDWIKWTIVLAGVFAWGCLPRWPEARRANCVMGLSICVGVLLTGARYGHYLIQAVPFAAVALATLPVRMSRAVPAAFAAGWVLCLASLGRTPAQETQLASGIAAGIQQPLRQAVEMLRERGVEGKVIFSPQYPIVNFLTGAEMPAVFTHPASYEADMINIYSGKRYRQKQLARDIEARRPAYTVVFKDITNPLPQYQIYLERHYRTAFENPAFTLYARKRRH